MKESLRGVILLIGLFTAASNLVGQFSAQVIADGNGNATISFGGTPIILPSSVANDPGPGGLGSALTYSLQNPPSLVGGDLLILDAGLGGGISDIIRFNPDGTGGVAFYQASFLFYSDNSKGVNKLSDTGFPLGFHPNVLSFLEQDVNGVRGLYNYTPGPGQPGYVDGFDLTYTFITQVPEPGTAALVAVTVAVLAVRRRYSNLTQK